MSKMQWLAAREFSSEAHDFRNLAGISINPQFSLDVTHEMRIMREETFGPVLPVAAFDDDDEAVSLANDSEFGLAASVWTRDRRSWRKAGTAYSGRYSAGE